MTLRRAPTPAAVQPLVLPFDVRLMNGVASGVFVLAGLAALSLALLWLTRAPVFGIRSVQIEGDLARNSVNTIRANAVPQLQGNFFSLNLQDARVAFESVPWVRLAVVRRVWPDRLAVRLEEHRAVALWRGPSEADSGNDKLVNSFGEVFEANLGDIEEDGLPVYTGPDGSAGQLLSMAQRLAPALQPLRRAVQTLQLSGRGSWRAVLDNGAVVELGRGDEDEVLARTERFVRTVGQVTGRYQQPLQTADLRHADGYAVRLRGVSTGSATTTKTTTTTAPPRVRAAAAVAAKKIN